LNTKCGANKKHSYEYSADANEKAPNMSWRLLSVSNFSSFTFCVAQRWVLAVCVALCQERVSSAGLCKELCFYRYPCRWWHLLCVALLTDPFFVLPLRKFLLYIWKFVSQLTSQDETSKNQRCNRLFMRVKMLVDMPQGEK
jgi:hypothetical protein